MSEKNLYMKKKRAQLEEWKADIDKIKAKSSGASADAQIELNKQIKILKGKIEEGKDKLTEISDASEDAWESIKEGVETSWDSMISAFSDAASKFKR